MMLIKIMYMYTKTAAILCCKHINYAVNYRCIYLAGTLKLSPHSWPHFLDVVGLLSLSSMCAMATGSGRSEISYTHRCQPSRIRRDSPAFSSDVPRPAKWDRCPAFLENCIIIFFVADYFTFLPCNATKWRTSSKARSILLTPTDAVSDFTRGSRHPRLFIVLTPPASRINTATVSDVPWVVDSDWIIASVLWIICTRCFPYSRDTLVWGELSLSYVTWMNPAIWWV